MSQGKGLKDKGKKTPPRLSCASPPVFTGAEPPESPAIEPYRPPRNRFLKITQLQPNAVRGELEMTVEGKRRQSQTGPAAFFLSNNFWKMISLFMKKEKSKKKKKKKKKTPVPEARLE